MIRCSIVFIFFPSSLLFLKLFFPLRYLLTLHTIFLCCHSAYIFFSLFLLFLFLVFKHNLSLFPSSPHFFPSFSLLCYHSLSPVCNLHPAAACVVLTRVLLVFTFSPSLLITFNFSPRPLFPQLASPPRWLQTSALLVYYEAILVSGAAQRFSSVTPAALGPLQSFPILHYDLLSRD